MGEISSLPQIAIHNLVFSLRQNRPSELLWAHTEATPVLAFVFGVVLLIQSAFSSRALQQGIIIRCLSLLV